jgi:phenylacetate-CoA ligase
VSVDLTTIAARRGVDLSVWPPRYDTSYLPDSTAEAWLPELEFADPADRETVVLAKLRSQLQYAWRHSPFYRRKWEAAGVSPDTVKSLSDLARLPLVRKDELRASQAASPPFGEYLCIEPEAVARIHGTSGTTGRPTVFGIGADDWRRTREAHARTMWAAGLRPDDRVMICSHFSLYMGSWGALAGGKRLGATLFPFGAGVSGQTAKAVEWAALIRPTAFYSTPSYALYFAEVAEEQGVDPRSLGIGTLFFSGEPGAGIPATKRRIEEVFGGRCIDTGTMAEMTPWMTSAECTHRTGMHLFQDLVYTEVCDPESGEPLPFGTEGTPVYTHLERTSQPMIRLLSGDRARWTDADCPCGRTYPRLPQGLYGRFDDMFIVRGANVYPSDIEDVLRGIAGFGGEFRIVLSRDSARDDLHVEAECDRDHEAPASREELERAIVEGIRGRVGVTASVELVSYGSLARTEFKASRVIDRRGTTPELTAGQGSQ